MKRTTLCLLLAACHADGSPTTDPTPDTPDAPAATGFVYPRGCYGVSGGSDTALLQNPGLVGVMVAMDWSDFERAGDNQFDFTQLDQGVAAAKQAGKVVVVGVAASAAKAPAWLVALPNVTKIQIADPNPNHGTGMITVVPFWDPTFRAQKLELIRAVGAHFASEPAVIGTMAGFANYFTEDWAMPPAMVDSGYSYDGLVDIGKEVLATTAEAFPNRAVKLPLGKNDASTDPDKQPTQMAEDIVAWAQAQPFADRFFAQKNLINTATLAATDPALDAAPPTSNSYLLKTLRDIAPHAGLQMVAAATDGPNDGCRQNAGVSPCPPYDVMSTSIDIALTYKPVFLEFWHGDAGNTDLYPLFVNATTTMQTP